MKFFPIFLLFTLPVASLAQEKSAWQQFRDLSRPVKWWVVTHPFSAGRALEIANHTRKISKALENNEILDGDGSGGQVDAFRHGYWMALMASEIGPRRAWRLGYDHEKGNKLDYRRNRSSSSYPLPTSTDCTMDLFNNDVGIELGSKYDDLLRPELKQIILDKIHGGYFIIIKKDVEGNPLDCDGNPLDREKWFHRWENPACLVPSNYIRSSSQ